ncbi:MAG: acyl-CoA thioesterase [Rhodothermales bacterium]|nr:acyl-CoA thioesterase [Rhodothermales bacterium]
MQRRVRYRECDPMGVVYHAHYVDWFEEARTEALRDLGLPYAALEQDGVFMPVVDLAVRYHHPALYDDLVEIVTTVSDELPTTRVRFDYRVFRDGIEKPCCSAHVTLCFMDAETRRPIRAPKRVLETLEEVLGD